MNEMPKKPRALRNVTITLDPELLSQVRVKAAELDKSVSQYIADTLRQGLTKDERYRRAMESYISRERTVISSGEPYPKRDEIYDRTRAR
mgnify:CR=1 FL=1